jgi:uncharacterized protein (UPF0216 family)|tara:strand:+ start:246 stop:680 length:435 start_codon:yes stop_codon:yes gene_type:complete
MHDQHQINDTKKWSQIFRKNVRATWLIVTLKDGTEYFIDSTERWHELKRYCDNNEVFLSKLSIQFKSHRERVDISDIDGIYFAKSIVGILGAESKQTYTIGKLKDGVVHKTLWLIPELIIEREYCDDESDCFEESIIHDKTKKN